jgi:hypothetical protein
MINVAGLRLGVRAAPHKIKNKPQIWVHNKPEIIGAGVSLAV